MNPEEAPKGVELKFLPRPKQSPGWDTWLKRNAAPMTIWESRPIIQPRLIIIHTNGASGAGSVDSAFNWSMAAPNNTKPTYQVDLDGRAAKFLPSNRKAIGNGTDPTKTNGVMAADFSLVIETADPGYGPGKPGETAGFTSAQAETLLQILQYEAELWHIDPEYPATWYGSGIACHTEPFGYPYWTIEKGKVCPGTQKKIEIAQHILPTLALRMKQTPNPGPTPGPKPTPGDDDVQVRLLILSDSEAQFLAQTDNQGQALYVTWAGPGGAGSKAERAIAAHRSEAKRKGYEKDFEQKGDIAGLFNCVRIGVLPYGDSKHTWTGAEFWNEDD